MEDNCIYEFLDSIFTGYVNYVDMICDMRIYNNFDEFCEVMVDMNDYFGIGYDAWDKISNFFDYNRFYQSYSSINEIYELDNGMLVEIVK